MHAVEFLESAYQTLIEYDLRRSFYLAGQRYAIKTYSGKKENLRGYDLEACALVPLFLQLKVSDFYPTFSTSSLQSGRIAAGIVDNPGCYAFSLHPDKKTATYKQHNLLAALHSGGSYSRYIAPLFHTEADLEHFKYNFRNPHWGPSASGLFDDDWFYWRDYVSFNHSISIAPHKVVNDPTTVSHHYTYSNSKYVCFHSDVEQVDDGESFIASVHQALFRSRSHEPLSLAGINRSIVEALKSIDQISDSALISEREGSQLTLHRRLVRHIKREFNIDCVLVSSVR